MKMTQEILRATIDTVENKYMKNCQKKWPGHWKTVRARLFKDLIELQLKNLKNNLK